jgi:hypothetical protein
MVLAAHKPGEKGGAVAELDAEGRPPDTPEAQPASNQCDTCMQTGVIEGLNTSRQTRGGIQNSWQRINLGPLPQGAWDGIMRDVTEQEVRDSLAGGGKSSAPGPSGITRETWVATHDIFPGRLVRVLNEVLMTENRRWRLPDDLIYSILKKPGRCVRANARPLKIK